LLGAEMLEIKLDEPELLMDMGFSEREIDKILAEIDPPDNDKLDAAPPIPEVPKSQLGDLYQLGRHRLLCGDATSKADVDRLMGGLLADMCFTDPPYGIDYHDIKGHFSDIENDKSDIKQLVKSALNLLSKSIPVYACCNWPSVINMTEPMIAAGFTPKSCIVWDKGSRIQNLDKYAKRYELILYAGEFGGQQTLDDDVWEIKRQTRNDHPTAKPVELCSKAIKNSSPPNGNVIDLFGGSGSTLIACEASNRNCYMMEIDPHYIDVIITRWENYTGQKAVKV